MFGSQPQLPAGLTKGSKTRLANEMNQAQQSGFAGNQAAINSIRAVTSGIKKRPQSNVGGYDNTDAGPVNPQVSQTQPPQGPPAVGTQQYNISALSAQPAVAEQPADPVEQYNRNAAIDHIISSPDMMDAVTKLKLRNHFQGRPDVGIGPEALSIVKAMHGIS